MNKLKRIFKEKITGERLKGLAKAFNVNLDLDFKAYDGWCKSDIYAQLDITPQEDSLKLEAYFHSKQVHFSNFPGSLEAPKYREGICLEKIIKIPYNKLNEIEESKRNPGTGTGVAF